MTKFLILGVAILLGATANSRNAAALAPILGNYPDTSVTLSAETTVTPDALPANTTSMNVKSSTDFKGRLEGSPVTGVVRVTDAHPAGLYTVTVRAFDASGASVTKTFALTVTTPVTCNPISFATVANFPGGNGPYSIAVGDFDSDAKQDLAVTNVTSNAVSIVLGNGAGSFSAPTNFAVGNDPVSVTVGDFNGDGKQDVATANIGSDDVSILLGNGNGSFSAAAAVAVGSYPYSIAVADFNGDGKQDLATANNQSDSVSILLGNGMGNFSSAGDFAVGVEPISLAVGDFNHDGHQDVVVSNYDSNNVSILLGNGDGSLSAAHHISVGIEPSSVAVGDFNGDGNQDVVATNEDSASVSILLGDGMGNFFVISFPAGNDPRSVAVGDFNGDGHQDLAVVNLGPSKMSILFGDGSGNFSAAVIFGVAPDPYNLAVGDFDSDGRQDLAAATNNFPMPGAVSILMRDCALTPTSVVSRKTHGSAGDFDINLPLTGSPGIECRTSGGTNDYTIIATFAGNISVAGTPQAQVTLGTGTVGSGGVSNGGMVSISGNIVTIPLTNVANAQTINITLFSVNGSGNVVIPMSVLAGDVNGNGAVNASDVAQAKSRLGQPIDQTNFRSDVNANGSINATDVSITKSNLGTGLP